MIVAAHQVALAENEPGDRRVLEVGPIAHLLELRDRLVVPPEVEQAGAQTVPGHVGLGVVGVAVEKLLVFRGGKVVHAAVEEAVARVERAQG